MLYPSELRAPRSQLYAQTQGGYNIRCSTHSSIFAVTKTEKGASTIFWVLKNCHYARWHEWTKIEWFCT